MAALSCEICGGKLMAKAGGIFECDSCGMMYDKTRIQEMVQEIKGTVKVEGTVQVEGTVKVEGGVNIESLLKRGFFALEDRKWEDAKALFQRALDINAECADAYVGLVMQKNKLRYRDDYREMLMEHLLDQDEDMQRAHQFASGSVQTQKELDTYTAMLKEETRKREENIQQGSARIAEYAALREKYAPVVGLFSGLDYWINECGKLAWGDQYERDKKKNEETYREWTNLEAVVRNLESDSNHSNQWASALQANGNHLSAHSWRGVPETKSGSTIMPKQFVAGCYNISSSKYPFTCILYSDGTVSCSEKGDQYKVISEWTDIDYICADSWGKVVGIKKDGTVLRGVKAPEDKQLEENLKGKRVVSVALGSSRELYLIEDGTVVCRGGLFGSSLAAGSEAWKDIIQVAVSAELAAGLKADGTVVISFSGWEYSKTELIRNYAASVKAQASEWRDIIAIQVYTSHRAKEVGVVGVQKDGTVVVANNVENNKIAGAKLFSCYEVLGDKAKWQEMRTIAMQKEQKKMEEENRRIQIEKRKDDLKAERAGLRSEHAQLRGIFSGKRRKEIEARLERIENELKTLN